MQKIVSPSRPEATGNDVHTLLVALKRALRDGRPRHVELYRKSLARLLLRGRP